ncbi:MAG: hypothetical protein ABEJ66_03840, partial [Candidatus Nanohaloarchaea archaeon]
MEEEVFENYEIDEETKVGLNLENFYSILRRANSNDTIVLSMDEDDSKFYIKMENTSTRNFSLPVLNLSEDDIPDTQNLEFSVTGELETAVLEDAIKDALVVGDSVRVSADSDGIDLDAEGDQSNVSFHIGSDAEGVLELEGGEADSMFSLDYLDSMVGAKKLSDTVTVKLGDDFPMRMEFTVPDKADLSFVLAPRIEEE